MAGKPLIGVTSWYDYEKGLTYIKPGYMEGVIKAGGRAVLLPATGDEELLGELFREFDGFLLSGGPDLDAVFFGEENLNCSGGISPYRDTLELFIARKAFEADKPIFGICRGMQVMNVAAGGSLYQDIYAQAGGREMLKHTQDAPKWYGSHEVAMDEGSKVREAYGRGRARVNSFHHQAVKLIAEGFKATSRTSDGLVESIEHPGLKFAVGVQWHPELMWQEDPIHLKLFESFIKAAGNF